MIQTEVHEMDEIEQMIDSDFDELTDSQILVLLIIDENTPFLKTRLQKISLLYHELYDSGRNTTGHGAYFFGGYSDDIDEAAVNLTDTGILQEGKNGYSLTEYGVKLRDYILKELDDEKQIQNVDNLKKAVSEIPDRNLVGLTYRFYEETAVNSTIKQSVDKLNSTSSYDGIPLMKYPKEQFERKLRNGEPIKRTFR